MSNHRLALVTTFAALSTLPAFAQVIDFETLPNGMPTVDLQEISTQYAAPPYGVTFRIVDRVTGAQIGFPKIAKVGAPRTAFEGCLGGADNPAPNTGTCQTMLTDDDALGSIGNLCLSGSVGRFNRPGEILNSGSCGQFGLTIDLTDIPSPQGSLSALPGDTWSFQCWYRDMNPSVTSNFSDAVSVQLQ